MAGSRIFLLRHAVAEVRDATRWPDDLARPLTAQGETRMVAAARGMRALALRFDLILTSPAERARRTAEIVARALRPSIEPAISPWLSPGGDPDALLSSLPAARSAAGCVLIVGHEPDLSRLAATLLLGEGATLPMDLRKGGLVRIDFKEAPAPGKGRLVYHLKPKILRLLAKPPGAMPG